MSKRWMLFVDGENFTLRGQKVAEKTGIELREGGYFLKNTCLWIPEMSGATFLDTPELNPSGGYNLGGWGLAIREYYYTSFIGDEDRRNLIRQTLWNLGFQPEVFKKDKQEQKAKGVDIALSKDLLSLAFNDSYDIACLVAGDGDYVPLIEEVKRQGKEVYVSFFSSEGLNPEIRLAADLFLDLEAAFIAKWQKLSRR